MIITIDSLQNAAKNAGADHACAEGIEVFLDVCGDIIEGEWTPSAQAFALGTDLRLYLGRAVGVRELYFIN